jgi:hypothetical protein
MKRQSSMAVVAGIGLLSLTLIPFFPRSGSGQAAAQKNPLSVEVVNTPLPVTGNVAASLAGPVQSAQSGVRIAGVESAAGAAKATDTTAAAAAQFEVFLDGFFDGMPTATGVINVPAGKRFVIETVTAQTALAPGDHAAVKVDTRIGTAPGVYLFPLTDTGLASEGVNELWAVTAQTKLYADSGSPIILAIYRNMSNVVATPQSVTLSGHLVDLP